MTNTGYQLPNTNSIPVVNLNLSSENGIPNNNNENINNSEFKNYIIQNNISLKNDNDKLLKEIKEKDEKLLELESETDKQDERIRYMRGLLHNLYELKTLSAKLSNIWQSHAKEISNKNLTLSELENYLNKIIFIFSIFQIINLLIILMFLKNNKTYFVISNLLPLVLIKISNNNKLSFKNLIFLKFSNCENSNNSNNSNNYRTILNNSKEHYNKIIELEQACAGVSVMIDNI